MLRSEPHYAVMTSDDPPTMPAVLLGVITLTTFFWIGVEPPTVRCASGAWLACEIPPTILGGSLYSHSIEAMLLLPQRFDR